MYVVAVDPGLNHCGLAIFKDRLIEHACLVKNPGDSYRSMVDAVRDVCRPFGDSYQLAIEMPQVYVASRSKGDPNDLIALAGLVGAFVYCFLDHGKVSTYKPAQWKGQVPKDVMTARLQKRLYEQEISAIQLPAKSLQHNVWDAVGIGMHHLSRI